MDSTKAKALSDAIFGFGVMVDEQLGISNPRVVDIGYLLNSIGGYDAMLSVAKLVQAKDPVTARELEFAWNGIGTWQA